MSYNTELHKLGALVSSSRYVVAMLRSVGAHGIAQDHECQTEAAKLLCAQIERVQHAHAARGAQLFRTNNNQERTA